MDKFENHQTQNLIFTKWLNNKLKKIFQPSINNLVDGFKSGRRFYSISNMLCENKNMDIPEQVDDRQLINLGLENIYRKFKTSLPTAIQINIDEIQNGDENTILILSWWMIKCFFAYKRNIEPEKIENDTLFWCQKCVKGYRGVSVTNFTNSWRDGCALLAILHHYKHNLFDFENRLSKTSGQNLTLALHLANQEFKCERLLELDHFTMSLHMDWKSVCLLLMELRQCIEDMSQLNVASAKGSEIGTGITLRDDDPSNPTFQLMLSQFDSTYKNTNDIMDKVIQQLNHTDVRVKEYDEIPDANLYLEKLDKDLELFSHLKIIKESAIEHEALMEMLATHQETVQTTLMSGNSLLDIKSVENSDDVSKTVREKLEATTSKWNTLYNRATITQKRLRKFLHNIQMSFLIKIENCIDKLEEIRNGQNTFGDTIDHLKEQLKINRSMEVEIEYTEKYIAELQSFLIYTDDSDSSDDDNDEVMTSAIDEDQMKRISRSISGSSFEQHIQSIGKRWNYLVSWVHARYNGLQKTLLSWRHFEEEMQGIFDWLEERICSADQLIRKSSRNQFNDFVNHSESRWGRAISSLDKSGQKVKDCCLNQPEVVVTIDVKIDSIIHEWNEVSEKWRDSLDNWIGVDDKRRSNRAASFSDMSSENCYNRRKIESANKNTPASLSDMNINVAPLIQAAYKTKFEADAERMMSWLENSAEKLELITLESISPEERPSIRDQRATIDSVSQEMNQARSKKTLDSIKRMGLMYQEDLNKSGENTDEIEQLFEEIDERWSYLEGQLVKSRQKVLSIEIFSELDKRSQNIDLLMKNALAFLEAMKPDSDLISVDNSIKDISQLRDTFIKEKNSLKQFADNYLSLRNDLTKLNDEIISKQIDDMNHKLMNQIEIIENEQVKIENNRTVMEMNLLPTEQWLNEMLTKVSAQIILNSFESLSTETVRFKSLESQLEYHLELLSKIRVPDASSKRFKILMDLQKISRNIGQRLEKRLLFLNDLSDKCNQWQSQTTEFEQWLEEVNNYLGEFEKQNFVGDEMIAESIKETEGGIQDLQNLLPTLENIEQSTAYIEAYFTKEFKSELNIKKQHLTDIWTSSHNKYVKLKEVLEAKSGGKPHQRSRAEPQKVAEIVEHDELTTEDGLVDIDMEHCSVSSDSLDDTRSDAEYSNKENTDNQELIREMEQWLETCRNRLKKFSKIENSDEFNEFGTLIEEIKKSKISYLDRINQKTVNNMFSDIKEKVSQFSEYLEKESQRYSFSNFDLKNFQSILTEEDSWVGKVNHVVQQSLSCNQLDVEELSENIDEIERVVCDHSEEDVNRLEDLKYSLMNARVLERSVSMEFDQIKEKSSVTKDKAKKHLSSLQQLLDHLQSVERRVSQMTAWIHDTSVMIKSRIAADLFGSDAPDEFEILKQSFADWEKFLQEMKDLEQGKRYQGRKETSDRLRLQRNQLEKSFRALKELFSRYSRPGDFEPRLNNLKREVNRVGEQIYLLDIISISPDDLESGLTHAKRFQESLIAEEEDLKYVYDLGKKLAEKKEIEFADRFSVQLDSLKGKYYDLLEQIKDAKQKLIHAKPIIEELHKKVLELESFEELEMANETEMAVEDNSKLVSDITELCDKLKPYTDYERSELVKDMFDDIKERCNQLMSSSQQISKSESITIEELCEEADRLYTDIEDYDFSDVQTLEEKLDTIYGRTTQLRQAASQIMSSETPDSDSDQSKKYEYLQQKLGSITDILSSHQNINGRIQYDKTITEDNQNPAQEEVNEEIICSNSGGSLNRANDTFASRENSFPDSLSSPISTEDMSNSENLVSDISYSVQAAKIEQNILHQVSMEMKDHIHSFILFCQNNIGSGITMPPGLGKSHPLITTMTELRGKINCVRKTVTEIFREQRLYLDHRLRELSAYAETSDQMEELDKIQRYWQESIGKLNKRIDRLTELDKRLETVEDSFKDPELQSSEKVRNKVLRLICQIEEELNVNLQKDKLRVTSHNRFISSQDSSSITKSNSGHSINIAMAHDVNCPNDSYRDSLKVIREQLKEVGKRLNSVRIAIDDSRRGCLSKLADRIQEIDENLTDSSHILAEVQYNITSGVDHQNNDAINLNFLIEAQKKRLTKYNNEFHSYIRKWMENATRWQEFVERLERLQFGLDDIEQELVSVVNGLDYSELEISNIKKSLGSFEKKLVQLEQDGEKLSMSCNDIDADFIHNRLSDLRSRYTVCLQSNRCSKLGIKRLSGDGSCSATNSDNALYNGNLSDSISTEKICERSTELKQSRSSELDFNANTMRSSDSTFPNDEYDSGSSGSSEELSTMVDGAATILDGRLVNWARITSDMISSVSLEEFQSIEALEDKITEITSIKKEALDRTAQITMGIEKHSTSDSNSISAELCSNLTDETNSQLLSTYHDLKANLYSKINQLCELKARYYHIKEQFSVLENISKEIEISNTAKISEQLQMAIKMETSELKVKLLRELIDKMPKGLKERLQSYFKDIEPLLRALQEKYCNGEEYLNKTDDYNNSSQLAQENINQIAVLLKSINTFMVKSKINLGQLEDIDRYLEHIKTFYDQLDRDRDILQSVLEKKSTDPNYTETVDRVDRLWNSTENKLQQREEELIKMRELKCRLDEIEASLNGWMQESDGKLNQLLSEGLGAKNQKILDDVKNGIPNWQQTLNVYQSLSYELTNTYNTENCRDIEANLERMNRSWSTVMNKLATCSREMSVMKTPIDSGRPDCEEVTEVGSSMVNEIENELSIEKLSGWLSSLEGQLETIEMGIVRWRSGSGSIGTTNADKLKLKVITQLNEMQNEIKHYEKQFRACSESERNESEYQIAPRWKIVKEKVSEIRQTLDGTPESGQQLLTKLRLLNDWLSHKDADLLEQKESPCNSYSVAHCQLRKFETLLTEIESHRSQVEEAIEQTQNKIGEVIDPDKPVEQTNVTTAESEGESDNSDTGSSTNTTDDKSKRLNRRLRRHSHHLKRKWIEISLKTKDFHEILKRTVQLLKSVENQIRESEQLLSEVEFHIDSWSQVATINSMAIPQEMAQTRTLLQSTQPIIDKFNSIDSIRGQLHKLKVTISEPLLEELEKINSRISSIKSLCETRLKQLHQHEVLTAKQATMLDNAQAGGFAQELPMESSSSSRKMTFPIGLSENRKFIELENESVSYPWERCLHPSGSEVPYYKNHSTQDTQWDHPIMAELIKSFDELNTIRFSAYRTAMKLRALQKTLCMDLIDLSLVADTFKMSGLMSSSVNERLLDVGQIIVFLASLFRSVNQKLNKSSQQNAIANNDMADKPSHSILGCARGSSIRHSRTKQKKQHTRSSSFGGFKNDDDDEGDKHEMSSKASCIKSPSKSATSQAVIMKCPVMANVPSTRSQLPNGNSEVNVPVCVDLALNWLLNVYDGARNGKIRVLSLKVAVVIMSNAYLDEKYKYLFSLICNSQGQIDTTRLTFLLTDCILLPKHLNESSNFGTESVEPSVMSCFKNNDEETEPKNATLSRIRASFRRKNKHPNVIVEQSIDAGNTRFIRLSHFLSWLKLEPQSLVWLPVLHRLVSAECAVHQAKCGVCKIQPIVGLRYRCLRCFNFDLCQACFFYSKIAKSHKVSHPMQEYCNVTSSKENIRDYSRIFRNRFQSKSRMRKQPKLGYLPVQNSAMQDQSDSKIQSSTTMNPESVSTNLQIHSRVERYANRLAEVEQLNRTHSMEGPSDMPMITNNLLLPDSINRTKDQNRNDEEHRLIAKYTDTLRSQMRNDSTMPPKSVFNQTPIPKANASNYVEPIQSMPPFQKSTNDYYAVPLNKNVAAEHNRFPNEQDAINAIGIMSNSVMHNTDEGRVQSSNASLNKLIHGLESQKRQLLDEYERLQSQTPVNNYPVPKSPYLSMSPRYATVDLGPTIGSRNTQFNQSLPPISSRTTSRPYGPLSNTGSLERSSSNIPPSSDLISEARMLREHKGKLENRMGLLEQRNRQLENQLNMLRHLIDDSSTGQGRMLLTPSNNIIHSFMANNNNSNGLYDQDAEMLTAAQYAASKRINEISCVSPNVNYGAMSFRYPGNSDNDMSNKGYGYSSGLFAGPKSQATQNFYGSLERGSSYRGVYDTTPVGAGYRSPMDRAVPQVLSANTYLPSQQLKAASDTGGSLSDSDFQMMCRSLADSCPTVTATPTYGQSTNSIGSLFHMAGQVGKAVGQLVNVMTDDFNTTTTTDNMSALKVPNNRGRPPLPSSSASSSASPNPPAATNSLITFNEDLVLPTSQSIINNSSSRQQQQQQLFSDSN